MAYIKPVQPPCDGRQFAGTPAEGSVSPEYLEVNYDKFNNEVAQDRPKHENTTPAMGEWNWSSKKYSDDFQGGWRPYGVSVEDRGQSPVVERTSVDVSRADRGKEA